jgi:hypothetical protein
VAFVVGSMLYVQDPGDEEPRAVTQYGAGNFGWPATGPAVDGDLVAWYVIDGIGWNTVVYANLATGEQRRLAGIRGLPAVNAGRIAWLDGGPVSTDPTLDLYDVATHALTHLETLRTGASPAFSGNLLAWKDNRGVPPGSREVNDDVYGFDLATRTEFPVATGPSDQTAVSVDADRIVWAEQVSGGWEVRMATVRRLIAESDLASLVQRMAASGEIRDAASAQTLATLVADAARAHDAGDAAKERDALAAVRDQAQRWAGRHMDPGAASRLAEVVNAMLPTLGAGVEGPGVTGGGTLAGR